MDVRIDRNRFYDLSIERVHHDDRDCFQTIHSVAESQVFRVIAKNWVEFTLDNSSNRAGSSDFGCVFDCRLERCPG